ncbi:hypothetical protein OH77DRAFT_1229749 [Trametes cingulata]|nr:hypothetical protein OH77DRAFT_1229749 [Trametes cingulata]
MSSRYRWAFARTLSSLTSQLCFSPSSLSLRIPGPCANTAPRPLPPKHMRYRQQQHPRIRTSRHLIVHLLISPLSPYHLNRPARPAAYCTTISLHLINVAVPYAHITHACMFFIA